MIGGGFRFIIIAIIEFIGFAFGLTGGILTLNRKMFPLALTGMALMMLAGILFFVVSLEWGVILGLPIVVLTVLSIIFISISRREFT